MKKRFRLSAKIQKRPGVLKVYSSLRSLYPLLLFRLSPVLLAKHRYRVQVGRRLPLEAPQTFDEKLFWLMLNWRHPLKIRCADKFEMRAYVEERGYGRMLVELLGVFQKSSEIDFESLPDRFVLKCTHGCGFNVICRDRRELEIEKTRLRLDTWIKRDFSKVYGEIHYAGIKPRIICERYLDDGSGGMPVDYKIHCFQGKVHFTTVCTGRGPDGGGAVYDHYDRAWTTQLAISRSGTHPERWIPRPQSYPEMLEAAEALAKPFPYVRMDFYCVSGKAALGEMTFTPAGCIDTGYTEAAQQLLGGLIQLPESLRKGGRGRAASDPYRTPYEGLPSRKRSGDTKEPSGMPRLRARS